MSSITSSTIFSQESSWENKQPIEKPSSNVKSVPDVEIGTTQWLVPEDFKLSSKWEKQWGPAEYEMTSSEAEYLRDKTANRLYHNFIVGLRLHLIFSMARTAVYDTAIVVMQICFRALKLVSFAYFWIGKKDESSYSLKGRLNDIANDIVKSLKSPFILLAQELSAMYGMINPEDGRKLYASLQRLILPKEHLYAVLQPLCFSLEEKDYPAWGIKK